MADMQRSTYAPTAMARADAGESWLYGVVDCALGLLDASGQCLGWEELLDALPPGPTGATGATGPQGPIGPQGPAGGGSTESPCIPCEHLLWDPFVHLDECMDSPPMMPLDGDVMVYRGESPGCWALEQFGGGGGWFTWLQQTANYTAENLDGILIDTATVGAFQVTLPANPVTGDAVAFIDAAANCATANLTIGRNGENIQGAAEDLVIDTDESALVLVYDETYGWRLYPWQLGGGGDAGNCYIDTGTYTGDGSTGQAISLTDGSLIIDYILIFAPGQPASAANIFIYTKLNETWGDYAAVHGTSAFGHQTLASSINSIGTGTFTVDDAGTDQPPNANGVTYSYIVWGRH